MKAAFIPGSLDMLSGEHFPHFVHMRENIKALSKLVNVRVLRGVRASELYMTFQKTRIYHVMNAFSLQVLRKIVNMAFFVAVFLELKRRLENEEGEVFLVRFCVSNYLIARYLHLKGRKVVLEVHALAHIERKYYGQSCAPPLYFSAIRFLEKSLLRQADAVIVVSRSLKRSLVPLGADPRKIHVIHNAVDVRKFDSGVDSRKIVQKYRLGGKIVVGFVGSFARYHGIELLMGVAETLRTRFKNIAFMLVGRNVHGADDWFKEVQRRGIGDICIFTGELPHERVPTYIAAMDVAMIPDFNTYGSPMKLFEYMAMGKAIVAPNVAPIAEVMADGETGILFPKDDALQAAKAVEKLILDKRLRKEIGLKARRKVCNEHTWEKNAAKIADILYSAVSCDSGQGGT